MASVGQDFLFSSFHSEMRKKNGVKEKQNSSIGEMGKMMKIYQKRDERTIS
jgi:hypothetical protein